MNCETAEKLILLDGTGELPPAKRRPMEDHIGGCAECREFAKRQACFIAGLGEVLPSGEPSVRAMARIREAAAVRIAGHGILVFPVWQQALAYAAMLLVVVGTVVFVMNRSASDPAVRDMGVIIAAADEDPVSDRSELGKNKGEAIHQLGQELLDAEGLGETDDSAIQSPEPDSTDPQANSTSAFRPGARA